MSRFPFSLAIRERLSGKSVTRGPLYQVTVDNTDKARVQPDLETNASATLIHLSPGHHKGAPNPTLLSSYKLIMEQPLRWPSFLLSGGSRGQIALSANSVQPKNVLDFQLVKSRFFPPIADPMLLGWLGVSHLLQGFVLSPFLQTMQLYIDANRRDGEPISWTWRMEISWEAIAHRCLLKSRLSWEWSLFPRQSARSKCEDSYK